MTLPTLPSLIVSGENGWVDLAFGLVGHKVLGENEFHIFGAGAYYADRLVTFNVLLPVKWSFDSAAPPGLFKYNASIALASAQVDDAAFIQTLAGLYGVTVQDAVMANFTEASAVSLQGNPERVMHEPIALKVFLGAVAESGIPYAEFYLNLDVPNGVIQLHEKDPEYREAIVLGLTKGTT